MRSRLVSTLLFVILADSPSVGVRADERPEKLYVGVAGLSGALAHAFVPKDSGLYEKYGLDVELIFFQGGTQAIQAALAGGVQMVVTAPRRRFGHDLDRRLYEHASLQYRCRQENYQVRAA
jgi:ABC-type nitrate/sulfonate/bicarbonate transport system substrate-binding protein